MSEPVSIIVLCHDQWAATEKCLRSLRRFTDPKLYEVLAYDNASTDATLANLSAMAREWPQLKVFKNERNLSFAQAVNRGMRAARGRFLLWLNNDTELTPRWLEGLLKDVRKNPEIAAVGPITDHMAPPQQIRAPIENGDGGLATEVPFLGGFCFLVRRSAVERVGPLDERFDWGWEDMDYCLRLRQSGLRLILKRDIFVHHHGNRTLDTMAVEDRKAGDSKNRDLMRRKWMPLKFFWEDVRELFDRFPPISESGLPSASIVVVCKGTWEQARSCLESIRQNAGSRPHETLAVCLGRNQKLFRGISELADSWPELKTLGPWPSLTWAEAVNRALKSALGEHFFVVDGRAVAGPGSVDRLIDSVSREPNLGIAGPKTNGSALRWQDIPGIEDASRSALEKLSARGYFFMIPRRVYERIGPFDERFNGSIGAVDYGLRAVQAGYKALVAEDAIVFVPRQADGSTNVKDSLLLLSKWAGHPAFQTAS